MQTLKTETHFNTKITLNEQLKKLQLEEKDLKERLKTKQFTINP